MKNEKIKEVLSEVVSENESEKKVNKTKFKIERSQVIAGLILLILLGGVWRYQKNLSLKNQTQPTDIVEQYRSQLKDLKEKAKSNNATDLQNYAVALYVTGDLNEAEGAYKKQLAVDENNWVAKNNLANVLRDEKKFDEAIDYYEQAIKLFPKSVNTYINLGSIYQYSLNDTDKALDVYARGMKANPESADLPVVAALAYDQSGNKEKAKENFKKALEIQENNQAAKDGLERLGN
jgi:tetratricopeptide (TPR) repeat protein